jgi:hypothetical protein
MSYSATIQQRGMGDNPVASTCTDFASWKAAQLACNQVDIDSPECAEAQVLPCAAPFPCPDGQTRVVETIPKRATQGAQKGAWGVITQTHCASPFAPAAVSQSVKTRWGLYLGVTIAAIVVFKVATG